MPKAKRSKRATHQKNDDRNTRNIGTPTKWPTWHGIIDSEIATSKAPTWEATLKTPLTHIFGASVPPVAPGASPGAPPLPRTPSAAAPAQRWWPARSRSSRCRPGSSRRGSAWRQHGSLAEAKWQQKMVLKPVNQSTDVANRLQQSLRPGILGEMQVENDEFGLCQLRKPIESGSMLHGNGACHRKGSLF